MVSAARKKYNASFTEAKYQQFLEDLNNTYSYQIPFRIAESPVFVSKELKHKLIKACDGMIDFICRPDFKKLTEKAVPAHLNVPNEDDHTLCLAIDFAVCKDANGELSPQLIELQGFPSLYAYEDFLGRKYPQHFDVDSNFSPYFGGLNSESYLELLREAFVGKHDPKNVILLEVEPEKQNTAIDFIITEDKLGIKAVCLTKIIKEGRKLFYLREGVKTPIYRIYNRVIFDELAQRTDLNYDFKLTDDVDVEWAGHPNWFFRISKYIMPFLKSEFVPESTFLSELKSIPNDLENYVLKPLFSFSGSGVIFNVKKEDIEQVVDKENFILQRKVQYEPTIESPDGKVKSEIRMLYIWKTGEARPTLVINLARLSKGEMIGVKYNMNKTWVGGSVNFFEKD
jgi:hypothetical protein